MDYLKNLENETISTRTYGMSVKTHYNRLRNNLNELYEKVNV